ncbi:MAG TPA: PilZ domain-containing protein [Planctomycetota bacterium]|nr:PilZ domain-containing protein [Planctomycetota bacterium]
MAVEIRYAKRSHPRVRTRHTRVGVASKKHKVFQGPGRAAEVVLDLSLSGIKMVVKGEPFEKNERIVLEILHPAFRGAIQIDGLVRWARSDPAGSDRWAAGVEFVDLDEKHKRQLDRLLALELGSKITIAGHGHVGFLARGTAELVSTLFVYDLDRHELGRIMEEKAGYRLSRVKGGKVETHTSHELGEVLRWAFGKSEGRVEVDPPVEK